MRIKISKSHHEILLLKELYLLHLIPATLTSDTIGKLLRVVLTLLQFSWSWGSYSYSGRNLLICDFLGHWGVLLQSEGKWFVGEWFAYHSQITI